jgi:hypothetical protein
MKSNKLGGISALLKYAPAGTYVTVEQLPHGGSLRGKRGLVALLTTADA